MQVYKSLLAEAKRHGSLQYKKLEYVSKVISKGDMFLHVGSGTCCLLLEIVDRFRLLIGVEIDAVALYMCKRRLARFSNIELVRCDARR
jgi:16S rRNA A1518/A1519 N6-dimethyltransferase RsmA/KsgA/DIM1 with predicted DNA glycosylase/AP lyase activity